MPSRGGRRRRRRRSSVRTHLVQLMCCDMQNVSGRKHHWFKQVLRDRAYDTNGHVDWSEWPRLPEYLKQMCYVMFKMRWYVLWRVDSVIFADTLNSISQDFVLLSLWGMHILPVFPIGKRSNSQVYPSVFIWHQLLVFCDCVIAAHAAQQLLWLWASLHLPILGAMGWWVIPGHVQQ